MLSIEKSNLNTENSKDKNFNIFDQIQKNDSFYYENTRVDQVLCTSNKKESHFNNILNELNLNKSITEKSFSFDELDLEDINIGLLDADGRMFYIKDESKIEKIEQQEKQIKKLEFNHRMQKLLKERNFKELTILCFNSESEKLCLKYLDLYFSKVKEEHFKTLYYNKTKPNPIKLIDLFDNIPKLVLWLEKWNSFKYIEVLTQLRKELLAQTFDVSIEFKLIWKVDQFYENFITAGQESKIPSQYMFDY